MNKVFLRNKLKLFICSGQLPIILLILLGFVSLWGALGWAQLSPLSSESAKHLSKAYQMNWQIASHCPWSSILNTITYPPCFYLQTVCWFKIWQQQSEAVAIFSVIPFLLISATAVYNMISEGAEQLNYGQKSAAASFCGALTCLAMMTSSLLIEGYLIEYALTAWVSAAFCLLTQRRSLSSPLQILLLTAVLSLGLLTKWTFISYLLPLLACLILDFFLNLLTRHFTVKTIVKKLTSAAICMLLTAFLAWLWYGARHGDSTNLGELIAHFTRSQSSEKVIQSGDPIFFHGFRAHSHGFSKFGPINFCLYASVHTIPPHLTMMILIGLLIAAAHGVKKFRHLGSSSSAQSPDSPYVKLFSDMPSAVSLSLIFACCFYSLYPTPDLFVPEKSLRHLAPLAPSALSLAFFWLPKLKGKSVCLVIPCLILSIAALFHWAIPTDSRWRGHILLGPSLPNSQLKAFSDPLGCLTSPQRSPLEKLCTFLTEEAADGWLAVKLNNREDFDPFLTELYGCSPQRSVLLINEDKTYQWLDPLTQMPNQEQPPLNWQKIKVLAERYQVVWLGYAQIQTVPELPQRISSLPLIIEGLPRSTKLDNRFVYVERAAQISAYRISIISAPKISDKLPVN
ncbi:MAG: hypothetical protein ACI38Q_05485 [Candidatus Bruticola sp.]